MNIVLQIMRAVLGPPASILYGAVTGIRNKLYDLGVLASTRVSLPIICVGNATVGGNGKTPVTQYLCRVLLDQGRRPVILSRGYGGRATQPTLVDAQHGAEDVGDEALQHMLRFLGDAHVVVSRDRERGAQFIEQHKLGDIIILDDGFQRRQLKRDIDLLLVDVSSEKVRAIWNSGHILPWGMFRERRDGALKRASALLLIYRTTVPLKNWDEMKQSLRGTDIARLVIGVEVQPVELFDGLTFESSPLDSLKGQRVVMLSAIAKPEGFSKLVEELGANVVAQKNYPDHYLISEAEFLEAFTLAETQDALLITTEKDLVKVRSYVQSPDQVLVLRLGVKVPEVQDDAALWQLVDGI